MLDRRRIVYAIGAPESGKTTYVEAAAAGETRRLRWDATGEFNGQGLEISGAAQLLELVESVGPGALDVVYRPAGNLARDFRIFCLGARAWGDSLRGLPGQESLAVIVNELADVSYAGKAPDEWGRVLRESRHFHLHVYATTQRPQECDKTILGTLSQIAVFWLPDADDRAYVARKMNLPAEPLAALGPLQFIETESRGSFTRGRLQFI